MLSRPVRYDPQEKAIIGADHVVLAHPFQKIGLPDREFHKIGQEIADCLNGGIKVAKPAEVPQDEALPPALLIVEPQKKKAGRPKGKR